jgi:hypothetical protein
MWVLGEIVGVLKQCAQFTQPPDGYGPHTIPVEKILLKKLIYSLEEIKVIFCLIF